RGLGTGATAGPELASAQYRWVRRRLTVRCLRRYHHPGCERRRRVLRTTAPASASDTVRILGTAYPTVAAKPSIESACRRDIRLGSDWSCSFMATSISRTNASPAGG